MVVDDARAGTERAFRGYYLTLTMVTVFNYLSHILTASGNDWTSVMGNLRKARKKWARMSSIPVMEGADAQV